MCNQGHNRLPVLENELADAMSRLLTQGSQFYELRAKVREIALNYPEYIVWSPELCGDKAVTDIWNHSWKPLACVSIQAPQEMQNAPMW